ncbi:GNAT family N-acetyltransferase [archaeon]|jgi:N-acetylglutamate synthase-like GNAT family acetyltransferase|nr:GNAT family N-acetyltransferase [archaeon]MBT7128614.1 GNAT family N-acetyltransferase [archaeon]
MEFRKAKEKDIFQILEIIKSNNPKYAKQMALMEIQEMFSKSLCKPIYIVAEEKKKIIAFGGFNSSWLDNAIFNVFWVNVNPKYRRGGVGSMLICDLIKRIKETKDVKAKMILISTKTPSFYKHLGFRQITLRYDNEYILMSLNL